LLQVIKCELFDEAVDAAVKLGYTNMLIATPQQSLASMA
jgi:hypothetical protein